MPKITWNNALNCGVKIIDDQHHEMVNKINQLYSSDMDCPDQEVFREILDEFYILSAKHFHFEEYLMEQAGHKDLKEHSREHADTLKQISALIDTVFECDKKQIAVLRDNLTQIIQDHLNGENYEYFADIRQVNEGLIG